MKIADMCRLSLFGVAALLILSGCKLRAPEYIPSGPYSSGEAAQISLTSSEQAVFERSGELDRNLSSTMEFMVRYHFVKYSREKRVTMEHFLRNAQPYLDYAKDVFRSKGLPEDLAYLAYLESGYSPLAVSRSMATGLWQFISSTGKIYGLSQDWWMDERFDPYRSTHAAADYLSHLYDNFGDWHLAIASYNGGEGAVGRAQKAAKAKGLNDILSRNEELDPSLQLREETRLYVPRFLALVKIMRSHEELGLKALPPDVDHPKLQPVVELEARPATDLVELTRRLGMTWKNFLAYNPHFLRSISPANRTASIYVPRDKEEKARKFLEGRHAGAGWRYYKVRGGETLASISKKVGVPAAVLRQLNPAKIKKGLRLRLPAIKGSVPPFEPAIPIYEPAKITPAVNAQQNVTAAIADLESRVNGVPAETAAPSVPFEYVVQSGDTLSAIAKKHGTTVREIQQTNGGAKKLASLRVGQVLILPIAGESTQAESAEPAVQKDVFEPVVQRTHKIKSGDTLSGIAKKYGTTVREIEKANGGSSKLKTLRIGQVIKLPYTQEQLERLEAQKKEEARRAEEARKAAEARAKAELAKATHHTVKSGDTLSGIARKYGVSVKDIQQANGGADKVKTLRVGQEIKLPARGQAKAAVEAAPVREAAPAVQAQPKEKASASRASARPSEHVVQSGDTLSGIARKYGVSVKELQQANGGASKLKTLRIGQKLSVPSQDPADAAENEAAAAALSELMGVQAVAPAKAVKAAPKPEPAPEAASQAQPEEYVVKSGDSIWGIARRFGMSVAEFKELNADVDSSSLRVGDKVRVIRKK